MNSPLATELRTASPAHTLVVLAFLFMVAWLPRVLHLSAFANVDERLWLARSANYYTAITHNDLKSTIQTDHPGVTVMWAGTLGYLAEFPEYAQQTPGQQDVDHFEIWINEQTEYRLLDLLVAGRRWIVLSISLLLALSFFPLREVFDTRLAVVAVLFMAWDPFYIALSRFLHLDGLLTAILTFSLLTYIAWIFGKRKARYLIISGITFGLAMLTKLPAVFLAPSAGLLAMLAIYNSRGKADSEARRIFIGVVIWGAIALGTFFLLWPALWSDPIGLITQLITGARTYIAGHEYSNFFMGEITEEPSLLFYPVAYLFRTTPTTLLGFIVAFYIAARKRWPLDTNERRLATVGMVLFTILFTVGMTTANKKFDRYLLPIFPVLDIVAALGWVVIARYCAYWWCQLRVPREAAAIPEITHKTSLFVAGILTVVVLVLGMLAFNNFPYYLTYYNPIMGGIQKASEVMIVGWGEGLDQSAAWINDQEGGDEAKVVSWYELGSLSYYLDSDKRPLHYWFPDFWFEADYAVIYINQRQREIPDSDTLTYFNGLEPVHSVRLSGLEMAEIYDLSDIEPPAFTNISTESAVQCSNHLALSAYQQVKESLSQGESTKLTLFLKTLSPVEQSQQLIARLQGDGGETIWQHEQMVGLTANELYFTQIEHIELDIGIPLNAASGLYKLSIVCLEPEFDDRVLQDKGDVSGISHDVTTITVLPTPIRVVDLKAAWAGYELETIWHQPKVAQEDTLRIALSAGGDIDGITKISMRLVDANGEMIAQQDEKLEKEMEFSLSIPDNLAPDLYDIAVVIYDPESLNPIPDVLGNEIIQLSTVEITPQ